MGDFRGGGIHISDQNLGGGIHISGRNLGGGLNISGGNLGGGVAILYPSPDGKFFTSLAHIAKNFRAPHAAHLIITLIHNFFSHYIRLILYNLLLI